MKTPLLRATFLLSVSLLILLAQVSATAQDVFDPVPEGLRARLVERFHSLIELRRTNEWDDLYELIAVEHRRGWSKSEFVRIYQQYPGVVGTARRLVMFVPRDILLRDGSDRVWVISGCATLTGLKFPIDAFVLASREKGDWYFSDLDALVPRDTAWRRCSFSKTRSGSKNAARR